MTKMKALTLMMATAMLARGGIGSPGINESEINKRERYKGKGFSGGQSKMRVFIIDGVEILATDQKMAKKKYSALKK